MKRLTKTALFASIVVAGQLYAQPAPGPAPAADPTPADPAAPAAPAVKKQLTPDQMKSRGIELVAQVRTDTQHVQYLQTVARREKDVIKLSCVNDKFVRLKASSNIFDNAYASLLTSLDSGDRDGKFDAVGAAALDTHKAREEADACVGTVELGDQPQSTFTSPEIIDDPTTGLPFDDLGDITVEPPGYASPYS